MYFFFLVFLSWTESHVDKDGFGTKCLLCWWYSDTCLSLQLSSKGGNTPKNAKEKVLGGALQWWDFRDLFQKTLWISLSIMYNPLLSHQTTKKFLYNFSLEKPWWTLRKRISPYQFVGSNWVPRLPPSPTLRICDKRIQYSRDLHPQSLTYTP